jgi:tetratricopeptide (TPR) repeat protein
MADTLRRSDRSRLYPRKVASEDVALPINDCSTYDFSPLIIPEEGHCPSSTDAAVPSVSTSSTSTASSWRLQQHVAPGEVSGDAQCRQNSKVPKSAEANDLLTAIAMHEARLDSLLSTCDDDFSSHRELDERIVLMLRSLEALLMELYPSILPIPERGLWLKTALFFVEQHITENDKDRSILLISLWRQWAELFPEPLDAAMEALLRAMELESLRQPLESAAERAWAALDAMGARCEQLQQYDHAWRCYESTLYARSRCYGPQNVQVAHSLLPMARLLEQQGNLEGSLDLYQAAKAILREVEPEPPTILREPGFEHDDAVESAAVNHLEPTAQTYLDLGQAYMDRQDYVKATVCLVEAAPAPQALALLQRVERLQKRQDDRDKRAEEANRRSLDSRQEVAESFGKIPASIHLPAADELHQHITSSSTFSSSESNPSSHRRRRRGAPRSPKQGEGIARRVWRLPRRPVYDALNEVTPPVSGPVATPEDPTHSAQEESSSSTHFPVMECLVLRRSTTAPSHDEDEDLSEITLRGIDDDGHTHSAASATGEWWWAVTAEGFNRWFPAVSYAVQAADAFLSAKAIHAVVQKKSTSAQSAVTDEADSVDDDSQDPRHEIASNVGIKSRASRACVLNLNDEEALFPAAPHHTSLFITPAPQKAQLYTDGKDIVSEILACRELLLRQQKEYGCWHATIERTLFKLAVLYSRDRDVEAALECATEALRIQTHNQNDRDGAQTLHFLADLYLHEKSYKNAVLHYRKALQLETNVHGYISEPVAKTLNCIGMVKLLQSEYRTSMESHEQALCILKECHDDDVKHPLINETLCHIGSVYYRQRYMKVPASSNGTVATSSSTGASLRSHPQDEHSKLDMQMLELIGRTFADRGAYQMAIVFIREKSEALEAPDVEQTFEVLEESAATLYGLGILCSQAGLYDDAITYYERALSIQLQLGCDDEQVATARVLTGAVQYQLGHWQSALSYLEEALTCYRQVYGAGQHRQEATVLYQMGVVQAALCDYDVAMKTLNDAYNIQRDLLGEDDPATLCTRREIGNLYTVYEAEVPLALERFHAILEVQKRLYERHPNLAETLHSIGLAHVRQKEYSRALGVLEECYYIRTEFLGRDHPLVATTLHDIAKIHLLRGGRHGKVLHICDVVLRIRREKLREHHMDIARTLTIQGACYVALGDSDRAYISLTEALTMAVDCFGGENHPDIADIYTEMSVYYLQKCQFDAARTHVQKALALYSWLSANIDEDHYGIQNAQRTLQRIEHDERLCV